MRYADRPTVDVDVFIEAPPERVWAHVTDLPKMGEWSPENLGGEWVDGDGPRVGAQIRARNRHEAIGEWETVAVVTECDPPRRFVWMIGLPENPASTWWFELEPEGDGTRVRQHLTMGPGPSGLTMAIDAMPDKEERIIARRIREHTENMTTTLEAIKKTVESEAR